MEFRTHPLVKAKEKVRSDPNKTRGGTMKTSVPELCQVKQHFVKTNDRDLIETPFVSEQDLSLQSGEAYRSQCWLRK